MTKRAIPILPTLVVAAAIAVMIRLGFWQLDRADEKEALIARAQQAARMSSEVRYRTPIREDDELLYRRTSVNCTDILERNAVAGTSERGAKGWAQRVTCALESGDEAVVDIGFAREPKLVDWTGGEVRGTIAPGGRIVAATPIAGLEPLARPDPRDLPNNHLAYVGQWFLFALTALVIYILALRRRRRTPASRG